MKCFQHALHKVSKHTMLKRISPQSFSFSKKSISQSFSFSKKPISQSFSFSKKPISQSFSFSKKSISQSFSFSKKFISQSFSFSKKFISQSFSKNESSLFFQKRNLKNHWKNQTNQKIDSEEPLSLEEIQLLDDDLKQKELYLRFRDLGIEPEEVEQMLQEATKGQNEEVSLQKRNQAMIDALKAVYKSEPDVTKELQDYIRQQNSAPSIEAPNPTPQPPPPDAKDTKKSEPEIPFSSPTFEKAYKRFKQQESDLKKKAEQETARKTFPKVDYASPPKVSPILPSHEWPLVDSFFPEPDKTPPAILELSSATPSKKISRTLFRHSLNIRFAQLFGPRALMFSLQDPPSDLVIQKPHQRPSWTLYLIVFLMVLLFLAHGYGRYFLNERERTGGWLLYPPQKKP